MTNGYKLKTNPMVLTTRETFPGEKMFSELCAEFFSGESAESRAGKIASCWTGQGMLVHMANPEQLDDLLSHIDRKRQVRFLSTTYIHQDTRPTVYAIGRGTGFILDGDLVHLDHVSMTDSNTVTAPGQQLVVSDHDKLDSLAELHAALKDGKGSDWNEVNVSFEGARSIMGIFSLDGVMSKLYAVTLHVKSGGLLPMFTYNRELNEFALFSPEPDEIARLIDRVPVEKLRNRYRVLLDHADQG